MNFIIYDVIIAAALLFFLWRGYSRGLILTLCSLLAVFVALIGASFLSNALAEPVAKAIEPIVATQIHDTVASYHQRTPETASQEETDWLEQLPLEELLEPLRESKFYKGYAEAFQNAVDAGVAEITAGIVKTLSHFIAVQAARIAIFAISFFAILIAWYFLSHALDLVAHLPVLYTANRWGGGAVGLAKGALVVFIAVWLFKGSYIPAPAVENTVLLKFFATADPLSFFL
jgi:uncharacterized membrane protein required for colicin V production